jgi:hypothetical protein
MKNKIFNFFRFILGLFPTPVPQGGTEFDKWAKSIIEIYKPAADERSVKFALCAMLMRLEPTEAYKSKMFFALCLRKASAAQVAAYKMEEIKQQQAAEEKAKQEAIKLEQEKAASDVQVQDQIVS